VAFEWNERVNGGMCFLKDSTGVVPRALESAISGVLVQEGAAVSTATIKANNAIGGSGTPGTSDLACAPPKTDL
jgi:hypothetical protein